MYIYIYVNSQLLIKSMIVIDSEQWSTTLEIF